MNRTNATRRITSHFLVGMLSALVLTATLLVGCGSASRTLLYPSTGTPTPRPDTLYLLNYLYVPGQPPGASLASSAKRILDPAQIQHFYEMVNALPPFPITTPPAVQCYSQVNEGYLLFLLHGQPTLEVDIEAQCHLGLSADLAGFVPGNPPKVGYFYSSGIAIASDLRMANQNLVHLVGQAWLSGVLTPVTDIPYQPPPK